MAESTTVGKVKAVSIDLEVVNAAGNRIVLAVGDDFQADYKIVKGFIEFERPDGESVTLGRDTSHETTEEVTAKEQEEPTETDPEGPGIGWIDTQTILTEADQLCPQVQYTITQNSLEAGIEEPAIIAYGDESETDPGLDTGTETEEAPEVIETTAEIPGIPPSDDAPIVISSDGSSVEEFAVNPSSPGGTNAASDLETTTGTIGVAWGEDVGPSGFGELVFTQETIDALEAIPNPLIQSDSEATVSYSIFDGDPNAGGVLSSEGNFLVGHVGNPTDPANHTFIIGLTPDAEGGDYEFTLLKGIIHGDPDPEVFTLPFIFAAVDDNGTHTLSTLEEGFEIDISNDAPVINGAVDSTGAGAGSAAKEDDLP